jgi:hypothetical protein
MAEPGGADGARSRSEQLLHRAYSRARAFAEDPSLTKTELKSLIRIYGSDYPRGSSDAELRQILRIALQRSVRKAGEEIGRSTRTDIATKGVKASVFGCSSYMLYHALQSISEGNLFNRGTSEVLLGGAVTLAITSMLFIWNADATVRAVAANYDVTKEQAADAIARVLDAEERRGKTSGEPGGERRAELYRAAYEGCKILHDEESCTREDACGWSQVRRKCRPKGEFTLAHRPHRWMKGRSSSRPHR